MKTLLTLYRTGYLVSAAAICIDYFYLGKSNRVNKRMLMASFVIKLSFVIVELAFILAFRITAAQGTIEKNTAAILEWGMHGPLIFGLGTVLLMLRQSLPSPSRVIYCLSLSIYYRQLKNIQTRGMNINSWRWI